MIAAGSCFFVNSGPRHLRDGHPWFVISDPDIDDSRVLYVNATTYRPHIGRDNAKCDPACIIEPGEHPVITTRSCLYFDGAHDASLEQLELRLERRQIRLDEPASEALLTKMRNGAAISRHIIYDHLEILIDQGLIN